MVDACIASPDEPEDADLCVRAARGDQTALAAIYRRYAGALRNFAVATLRDREAAADCVQDVFCTAATHLHELREPDKLRPWLYAMVYREARQQLRLRYRRREQNLEGVPDTPTPEDAGPHAAAANSELADLISRAADGLSERDRTVLELHYRAGLDGFDLADALGVSHTNANTMVGRLRTTIERSLGALLVARHARAHPGRCPALDTVLNGWDGQLTVLMRKRIARHLDQCAGCATEKERLASPSSLLRGVSPRPSAPTTERLASPRASLRGGGSPTPSAPSTTDRSPTPNTVVDQHEDVDATQDAADELSAPAATQGGRRHRTRPPGATCRGLVLHAASLLPAEHQDRYRDEWTGELWDLPWLERTAYALRLIAQAWAMRRALAFQPVDELHRQTPWWDA